MYVSCFLQDMLYTAHADELPKLAYIINNKMMKKERLPQQDSLDGLLVVRAAWDIVDIGEHTLKFFKKVAKVAYVLMLLLSVAIVVVTVQTVEIDASLNVVSVEKSGTELKGSQLITFCLSLAAAFVAAVQAFYNPVRRWQQVRDATANMESAIWQFRCRAGVYAQGSEGPAASTQALSAAVRKCREAIMVSADVQETSFHAFYPLHIYRHGQRPRGGTKIYPSPTPNTTEDCFDPESPEVQEKESFDNNYSPTKPEDYIRLRILKMLRFYRKRLPNYARQRDFCQWIIMVGTVAGALIAFLGFAPQVAIVTSVTTSVAAWLEFHSTAQKVSRYNGIIVSLSNILLWWDSMGDVDKASPMNIDLLVQMGEATLNAERGAWLSAGASKEDQEKDKKGKDDDEDETRK